MQKLVGETPHSNFHFFLFSWNCPYRCGMRHLSEVVNLRPNLRRPRGGSSDLGLSALHTPGQLGAPPNLDIGSVQPSSIDMFWS